MIKKIAPLIAACTFLASCQTVPTASSHQHVTEDGKHWAIQITMHTGVPNTPQQTVMIVYNKWTKTPIALVDGQTQKMDEKLFDDVVKLAAAVGGAAITGGFVLQAAKADCPTGSLCGTLVQVQNTAGANADANSKTTSN